ncbi:hypothetical protein PVAND_009086 [Polypedilum vanderplanki]|uniref:peptidylamidoglycolate lyase n=1 Tax=Polypedilum vanderplanki TaxID=319348 RepID=A0A9J6CCP6_POLVA|nr:hypothetical protein PVAND_009086 [Polypedilum vanderplanki]
MIKFICIQLIIFISFINLSLEYEDYDENSDYGKFQQQQFMNLQAAQKNVLKKSDEVTNEQYAESGIQNIPVELKQDYTHIDNWPTSSRKLGAISAVALDVYKNVVVFHRAERIWDAQTFDSSNNYRQQSLGPIKDNTVITFDRETGMVINEWGKNFFYMPHGLHINGNYHYITDVALHQVFRFNIKNSTIVPELVLGKTFTPGKSANSFCKPTSVAALENGDFFVADGYCNARIVKYSFSGEKLLEWGRNSFQGENSNPIEPPNAFAVPHALTLVPSKELLCVADRENGRIQCFSWTDGKYHSQYHSKIVGDRIFSVDYADDRLFVVNGPEQHEREVAGYIFDMNTNEVVGKFGNFLDPHDLAVTSNAREIYIGDLSADKTGNRLHKYILNGVKPTITREGTAPATKVLQHRGETALIVGSIMLLFTVLTVGIAILISKRKRRGKKIAGHLKFPWEMRSSKNFFYNEYNQLQNDDYTSDQNEFA